MTEANQIRINELARDLEVKAKAILDYLPEAGVAEKKTHSSSIDLAAAEKVRAHFRQLAEEEAAAEANAQAEKAAKEAAAKAARLRPAAPSVVAPAGPKAPATVPAAAKPPAPAVAKPTVPAAAPVRPSPRYVPLHRLPLAELHGRLCVRQLPQEPVPLSPLDRPRPALPRVPAALLPEHRQLVPVWVPPALACPCATPALVQERYPFVRAAFPLALDKGRCAPARPYCRCLSCLRQRRSPASQFTNASPRLAPVPLSKSALKKANASCTPFARAPASPSEITITEGITVRELAEKLDVRAKDVLKDLLDRGVFASINQALDVPTATSLAEAFSGIVSVVSFEEEVVQEVAKEEKKENLEPRPPVVTVMGHVDHGKTSLLDAIRQTDVAAGEAGGITQHIGASVVSENGRRIVFIDTPGHEAFTRMRARGAKVTDLVVLVVAADDGIMPQTLEAVDHARAAGVPIVVAINKVDKPEAQPERVKRQLADRGLMPEEWGGDTVVVEVSAREKKNLDKLLEMILLVADLRELRANPSAPASGTVLESRVDRGRGPVATVLVQNGTLHTGDVFIVGAVYGKVRALFDDHGHAVKQADPSTPVEVLGLQGVPEAGDHFQVADEAKARHIVDYRQTKLREASLARSAGTRITLDQLHEQLKSGETKELPIVIKADVQGSVEVLSELLPKLSTDQVKLKIIHASVGAVTETDVLLASASGAIIFAFNVRPDRKAADLAQRENVDIRMHSIIYEVTDEIKRAMTGLLEPVYKETHLGRAEVRDTFRIKGVGMIAGCYVLDGIVKRDAEVRVVREGVVIYTGRVSSLRRFKEDANEVRSGFECGVGVSNFNDIKVGDVLECFSMQKQILAEATA